MVKKWTAGIRQVAQFLEPMDISIHSAYTSFFLVLSVFPSLVLLFGMLAYTSLGLEEVMNFLEGFLPIAFLPLARKVMSGAYEHTSGTIVSLSALTALWSAARGIRGLLVGLNAVNGLQEERSYLATRGLSMVYTFLFLIVLVLTLVFHVFGRGLIDYLRMTTNPFLIFIMDIIDGRFMLLLVMQTALFAAMYAYLPSKNRSLRGSLPGAILASAGWLACSNLFSLYVEYFPNYANVYGSFYAAALAMLWLYICICIVFYGAALNRWLAEHKKAK